MHEFWAEKLTAAVVAWMQMPLFVLLSVAVAALLPCELVHCATCAGFLMPWAFLASSLLFVSTLSIRTRGRVV